jgi:hypothetical protein
MNARLATLGTSLALFAALAGCGTPKLGEPCTGAPELGGCEAGAYCVEDDRGTAPGSNDDPTWSSFTCRAACTSQASCAPTELCEGVPTTPTLRVCRPRSTP